MSTAIGPIAMWVVIGLLAGGGLYFIYRKLVGGAIAKDDLGEVAVSEKERQDASEELRSNTGRMRDAWRRVRDRPRR